jgi:3D (Asp-Asp-Asp) domain-containing protein
MASISVLVSPLAETGLLTSSPGVRGMSSKSSSFSATASNEGVKASGCMAVAEGGCTCSLAGSACIMAVEASVAPLAPNNSMAVRGVVVVVVVTVNDTGGGGASEFVDSPTAVPIVVGGSGKAVSVVAANGEAAVTAAGCANRAAAVAALGEAVDAVLLLGTAPPPPAR